MSGLPFHVRIDGAAAREILASCGVPKGSDFHRLTTDQVLRLVAAADLYGYRAPPQRNGSRGRYWHALLERRASK